MTTINEHRYQFVLSLYLIRTQYPQMGLFQPDFIWVIFRSMMPSKYNRSDNDIKDAVNKWCKDPVEATVEHGYISKWNTSLVTNMNKLFEYKRDFNDDISKWNVSNVTNMDSMFGGYGLIGSFNGDISGWNVSSVTNMSGMFHNTPFNEGISLDGMSAVLLTWSTCSIEHPLMGISLDGMLGKTLTSIKCSWIVLFLKPSSLPLVS
jgi:surface protein